MNRLITIIILILLNTGVAFGEHGYGFFQIPTQIKAIDFYPKSKIIKRSLRREKFDYDLQEFKVIEPVKNYPSNTKYPIMLPPKQILESWKKFLSGYLKDKKLVKIVPKQAGAYVDKNKKRKGIISFVGLYKRDKTEYVKFHGVAFFRLNAKDAPDKILYLKRDTYRVLKLQFITNTDNDNYYEIVIKDTAYAGDSTILIDPVARSGKIEIKYIDGDSWD